jgi:hypothetical protein
MITLLICAGILALFFLLVMACLKSSAPAQTRLQQPRGREVEFDDIKGVNIVSSSHGTTVTDKRGKVLHKSDARGVIVHSDQSGVKNIREIH